MMRSKKSPFKASVILDRKDIRIVEARYLDKPFFFGVGTIGGQARGIEAEVGVGGIEPKFSGRGGYKSEKEFRWNLYFNQNNMSGFLPMDQFGRFAAATTTLVSGAELPLDTPITPLPEEGLELGDVVISDKGVDIRKKRKKGPLTF